jgi:hypothetical protein
MIWCHNLLRVRGAASALDAFIARAKTPVEAQDQLPGPRPLLLEAFVPRPAPLDLHETAIGRDGYTAWFGDWRSLLGEPRLRALQVSTQDALHRYLDWTNPEYRRLAHRYAENERQFGHRTWLTWNYAYFGVKWDLDEKTSVRRSAPTEVIYCFTTLEFQPLPWFRTVQGLYPDLQLSMQARAAGAPVRLRVV